ncbi:MAG: DUF3048 domain-containing protein [Clostridia bacterium]|nr:DUF3048 domain-containing protein [Clostridia bacterium]
MKKLISIVLLTAMALAIFAGCSSKEETTTAAPTIRATTSATQATTRATTAATTAATEAPTEATTAAYEGPIHPLTGLPTDMSEEMMTRKPVAIMIGNSKDALPQLGISQADILIEMMAEGGTTRLMGIWQDPSEMKRIGSVRSARPYFIDMAQGLDAYFLHFGGSVPAYDAIKKRDDLVNLDGIKGGYEGSLYIRDPERKKSFAYEHTVVTSGERIEKTLAKFKNTTKKNPDQTAFNFNEEHSALSGTNASKVTIDYFTINKPYFVYNEETGTYDRFQHKQKHYDAEYDQQVSTKNIIILEMPFEPVPGDPLKIVEVQTTGSGKGMYFCEGKMVNVKWSKAGYNKPLVLTDEKGNELKVAPGQTFLATVKTGATVTVE